MFISDSQRFPLNLCLSKLFEDILVFLVNRIKVCKVSFWFGLFFGGGGGELTSPFANPSDRNKNSRNLFIILIPPILNESINYLFYFTLKLLSGNLLFFNCCLKPFFSKTFVEKLDEINCLKFSVWKTSVKYTVYPVYPV